LPWRNLRAHPRRLGSRPTRTQLASSVFVSAGEVAGSRDLHAYLARFHHRLPETAFALVPEPPLADVQTPRVFDAAEELELREQQYDRALAALQPLVNEAATRPEALLRIARIEP